MLDVYLDGEVSTDLVMILHTVRIRLMHHHHSGRKSLSCSLDLSICVESCSNGSILLS